VSRVGQNHIYIRCIYGIFGREITKYTVIYGVYIRFWPTLHVSHLSCLLILSALISTHTYIPASRLTLVCIQGAIEGHILGTFEDRAHLGFLSAFSGTFSITSYVHTGHTSYVHTGHTSYAHTGHTSYVHTGHTNLLSLVCHAHCCSPKAFHGIQTCYPLFATHNAAVRRHLTAYRRVILSLPRTMLQSEGISRHCRTAYRRVILSLPRTMLQSKGISRHTDVL